MNKISLLDLQPELVIHIFNLLDIWSKYQFLLVSKYSNSFRKLVKLNKIRLINFRNNHDVFKLTNLVEVVIGDDIDNIDWTIIPKTINITFKRYLHKKINKTINKTIHNSVKYLSFESTFYQNIGDIIPDSVTHLTLGDCSNQDIKGIIPNCVTHLTLGYYFKSRY